MAEQTMDTDTKQKVKDGLIAHLKAEQGAADRSITVEQRTAQIDPEEHRVDAVWQLDEAGERAGINEQYAAADQGRLDFAEQLDVTVADQVGPGTVVGFDGDRYIAGVVADAFEVEGVEYQGISTDSPAYAALLGKHLGDQVTIGRETTTIDFLA